MLHSSRRRLTQQSSGPGRHYIPRIPVTLPQLQLNQLNQLPRWAKVSAAVAGAAWVGYSALYFSRIQTCEAAFQRVEPRVPKVECVNRKAEKQLLKDLLADVPSGPICVQDYSTTTSAEFLLSVLSARPASIVFDTQRWSTMTTSEVAAELSRDLCVYHVFLKQKLQELLATFWNVRSDAGAMRDLTALLATATKALEAIKKIDPQQHHPPVIYVHGPCKQTQAAEGLRATANGTVPAGSSDSAQSKDGRATTWEQVFRNWCLEVANQRLAHVIFTSELDDLDRPLADSGGPVNVLTLNDLHAETSKELLQKMLLAVASGHSAAAPKTEKKQRGSDYSATTVHGTVVKRPAAPAPAPAAEEEGAPSAEGAASAKEATKADTAARSASEAVTEPAKDAERTARLRNVVDIAVDLLGGDAMSANELVDIAKTYARTYRMKSVMANPEQAAADGSSTINDLDVWLLDSLNELVRRHWLRTVTALSDLYDPQEQQAPAQQAGASPSQATSADSVSSIVRVSAHRIRLLYALRELSLHGAIPARKFAQTLLDGDEKLFQTLISRQIIRVKLADNALPLSRIATSQEAADHLQVVCGSEVVRRALQVVLLLGNSAATPCLHQLPAMHASLQKVADPAWVRQLAQERETAQPNHGIVDESAMPEGLDSMFFGRKNTTNHQLKEWVQTQVQLTKKLGRWLSVSPTAAQWRDLVQNFPVQFGVVPSPTPMNTAGARDPRTAATRVAAAMDKLSVFNNGLTVTDVQQLLASVGKFYSARQVEEAMKYLRAGMFDSQATLDGDDIVSYLTDPASYEQRMAHTPHHWFATHTHEVAAAQTQHVLLTTAALCDSESPASAAERK